MAVTVTQISDASTSPYHRVFDIEATADADAAATITHGLTLSNIQPAAGPNLGSVVNVIFEPLLDAFYTSRWFVASRTAGTNTQITLTKGTGVGSGAVGAQLRVHVYREAVNGW